MRERAVDRWCVIASSEEVDEHGPTLLTRFGEGLVLWRDPTGALQGSPSPCRHGALALHASDRSDPVCLECAVEPPPPALHLHEARGWIWLWRGEPSLVQPNPACFTPPSTHTHELSSQVVWSHAEAEHAKSQTEAVDSWANLRLERPSTSLCMVSAFVPIDDERTCVYLRSYSEPLSVPGLSWILDSLSHRRHRQRLQGLAGLRARRGGLTSPPPQPHGPA